MTDAFIVDAVRSPVAKRGGALSSVHPADLGAHSITALNRSGARWSQGRRSALRIRSAAPMAG